ncbi:MAG: Do family serine endopeptidase [Planctomycetaceae bacterium]
MNKFRWPTLITGMLLGLLAAGVFHQSQFPWTAQALSQTAEAPRKDALPPLPVVERGRPVPGAEHADQLSGAFRSVSRAALPAVVSIKTTGRVVKRSVDQSSPFDDPSSPFNDPFFQRFFGNDPRFRQFRNQQPREFEQRLPDGQGSGFIVSPDGIVMTNNHVVADAEEVIVRLSDGREFTATDIRADERSDVAVVRIRIDEQLPFLPLGDESESEIGDWVLAFGSPFGLDRTVTQGIISAKSRAVRDDRMAQEFIQTDAAINPGNSGGPLVNLRGEVIGINTAISTRAGGYDGVGFAVPVSLAKWVAEQLLADGTVERAFVGIEMQEIDAELAKAFNLTIPRGIVVTGVVQDSPAEKAGFAVGDVILDVAGKAITSDRSMLGAVERLEIGQPHDIRILRNGQERVLRITVSKRPQSPARATSPETRDDNDNGGDGAAELAGIGVAVQNLTNELAQQLGLPDSSGVVITSVDRRGTGARAGLNPGMVITRIGSQPIRTVDDAANAMNAAAATGKVLLLVRITQGEDSVSRFVTVDVE